MANVPSTEIKRKLDDDGSALMTKKRPFHKDLLSHIDSICARCASILPIIISSSNATGTKQGTKLCALGSSDTWLVGTCELCKLLSAIRPDYQNSSRYDLMAFHISVLFRELGNSNSNALTYLKQQKDRFLAWFLKVIVQRLLSAGGKSRT